MRVHQWLPLTVVMAIVATAACRGELVITGFQGNGELSVTGLWTNASCRVEWASSLTGQWCQSWEDLKRMPTRTNTAMVFKVPMFYRVVMAEPPEGMVVVPGGTFTMGSDLGYEADPDHQVTLSTFCLSKYETTYGLWYEVKSWASTNGYSFANAGVEGSDGVTGAVPTTASNEPVTTVNWCDAIVWCNARSEKEELTPVYTDGYGPVRDSSDATACNNARFNTTANGYRLPTEAEWEYAARYQDGTTWTPGHYASGATNSIYYVAACEAVAWFEWNSYAQTHPVGEKAPNQLMAYDMSGNVSEFCWDWWYEAYSGDAATNPIGPASGSTRVYRGGSCLWDEYWLRCAYREHFFPYEFHFSQGFRCARGL